MENANLFYVNQSAKHCGIVCLKVIIFMIFMILQSLCGNSSNGNCSVYQYASLEGDMDIRVVLGRDAVGYFFIQHCWVTAPNLLWGCKTLLGLGNRTDMLNLFQRFS